MNKVVKEKFNSLSHALRLQAKEYSRRLKELNGEASRLKAMQEKYVPREMYDKTIDQVDERRETTANQLREVSETRYKEILKSIADLNKWKDSVNGSIRVIIALAMLILSAFVYTIFHK